MNSTHCVNNSEPTPQPPNQRSRGLVVVAAAGAADLRVVVVVLPRPPVFVKKLYEAFVSLLRLAYVTPIAVRCKGEPGVAPT